MEGNEALMTRKNINTNIKISIIIPIYQAEEYLERCLNSILTQDYTYWEAILIDDGSKDQSREIAEKYVNGDSRFSIYHQENRGQASARNVGLSFATGDYIMFLDSDDWWYDFSLLKKLVADIEKNDWDILIFDTKEIKKAGERVLKQGTPADSTRVLKKNLLQDKLSDTVWDKIYRTSLWSGVMFPEGHILEDFYILPEVFDKAQKIGILNVVGYAYNRLNEKSTIATKRFERIPEVCWAISHHLELIERGVISADEEVIRYKRRKAARFALRTLIYQAGGVVFSAIDIQTAQQSLQRHGEVLKGVKHRLLLHWVRTGSIWLKIYAKIWIACSQ